MANYGFHFISDSRSVRIFGPVARRGEPTDRSYSALSFIGSPFIARLKNLKINDLFIYSFTGLDSYLCLELSFCWVYGHNNTVSLWILEK